MGQTVLKNQLGKLYQVSIYEIVLKLSNCIHLKDYSVELSSNSFFLSSDIKTFYHLLGYHAIGINSSGVFF